MKITVFDSWAFKFTQPVIDHWRALGHDVATSVHWNPALVADANVAYFYPVDNNLKTASRTPKPPGLRVVAEAVDIDIYAGHPGAVQWDYVDALVCMSSHMLDVLYERKMIPSGLEVHMVPGGVDLERFVLRQSPKYSYNVAWIGRMWIAKNIFGALQIFNQLIETDQIYPPRQQQWHLHCLGQRYDPAWWQNHVEAYLEANPALAERVTFTKQVTDVNEWLEDKDFLLQTSFKEAFSYVTCESAAKGIRPVIQMTNGMPDIWPKEWIFQTHAEAVAMLQSDYDPMAVRGIIAERYPLAKRLAALDQIVGI